MLYEMRWMRSASPLDRKKTTNYFYGHSQLWRTLSFHRMKSHRSIAKTLHGTVNVTVNASHEKDEEQQQQNSTFVGNSCHNFYEFIRETKICIIQKIKKKIKRGYHNHHPSLCCIVFDCSRVAILYRLTNTIIIIKNYVQGLSGRLGSLLALDFGFSQGILI